MLLPIAAACIWFVGCSEVSNWWQKTKAHETMGSMRNLSTTLEASELDTAEVSAIQTLLAREGLSEIVPLQDAWGNDFVIEIEQGDSDPNFRTFSIRSLGRDGSVGSCCRPKTRDFDDDALIVGGKWQQVWIWP